MPSPLPTLTLLTAREVASYLHKSRRWVLENKDKIGYVQHNGRGPVLFLPEQVAEYHAASIHEPTWKRKERRAKGRKRGWKLQEFV